MAGNLGYTYADVINESLAILGVLATGENLSAAEQQSAAFTLQGIIDGWGLEPLTVIDTKILTFTTIAGQAIYKVGPDGTNDWIVNPLPVSIARYGMQMGTIELPIDPLTLDRYADLGLKGLQSSIMESVWPDYGAVFHALNFFPVPNTAIPVRLYIPDPVGAFASTATPLALPAGYREPLIYELALKVASKFGKQIPEWLPTAWADGKAKIKGANFEPLDVACDPALVATSSRRRLGGSLDFYLGK